MNIMLKFCVALLVLVHISGSALAAGGGVALEPSRINVADTGSLQRGAKTFVNYCLSCHGADYMRYQRLADDLELTEEMVMENLVFADAKIGDRMTVAMNPSDSERWFGKTPPNLSLIARSRGPDWLYGFLRGFYQDENGVWNNRVLPNAAMPHVMWRLQGIQVLAGGSDDEYGSGQAPYFETLTPGTLTEAEYDETVRDLVAYLSYMAEPAQLVRKKVGVWVLLFLAVFTFLAYLLKQEYWRDIH